MSEEIQIDEMDFKIDPAAHKQQQKLGKIRALSTTTSGGEKSAADAALKRLGGGPSLPLANSYEAEGELVDEMNAGPSTPVKIDRKMGVVPNQGATRVGNVRLKPSVTGSLIKTVEEVEQVDEKLNMKKEKMGDVIKDFYKSDAPQFKGKSKEKRRQMAIAAKLTAERGGRKLGEQMDDETVMPSSTSQVDDKKMEQQRKRIQMQKIKDLTVRLSAARKGVY